jgi:hypothetical protein
MDFPSFLVVRDNDLARLEQAVNDRIEEGYSLAGQLFAVTPAQGGVLYVQPLVLEMDEDDADDDDADDDDEGDDSGRRPEPPATRRPR